MRSPAIGPPPLHLRRALREALLRVSHWPAARHHTGQRPVAAAAAAERRRQQSGGGKAAVATAAAAAETECLRCPVRRDGDTEPPSRVCVISLSRARPAALPHAHAPPCGGRLLVGHARRVFACNFYSLFSRPARLPDQPISSQKRPKFSSRCRPRPRLGLRPRPRWGSAPDPVVSKNFTFSIGVTQIPSPRFLSKFFLLHRWKGLFELYTTVHVRQKVHRRLSFGARFSEVAALGVAHP